MLESRSTDPLAVTQHLNKMIPVPQRMSLKEKLGLVSGSYRRGFAFSGIPVSYGIALSCLSLGVLLSDYENFESPSVLLKVGGGYLLSLSMVVTYRLGQQEASSQKKEDSLENRLSEPDF